MILFLTIATVLIVTNLITYVLAFRSGQESEREEQEVGSLRRFHTTEVEVEPGWDYRLLDKRDVITNTQQDRRAAI